MAVMMNTLGRRAQAQSDAPAAAPPSAEDKEKVRALMCCPGPTAGLQEQTTTTTGWLQRSTLLSGVDQEVDRLRVCFLASRPAELSDAKRPPTSIRGTHIGAERDYDL